MDYSPTSMANTKILKTGKNSGTTKTLSPADGNTKLGKSFWQYLVKFKTSMPNNPVFPLLYITPRELCTHEHQMTHTRRFIAMIICNKAKLETTQIPINSGM